MSSTHLLKIEIRGDVSNSLRAQQVSSMFDAPAEEKCAIDYEIEFPWNAQPFNVGLVVGPSGSGKTTVLKHAWGEPAPLVWQEKGVIDDFAKGLKVDQISAACSAVGFNTIPAWMRPYSVLSGGEKFRIEVARRMLEAAGEAPIVIDEFTSVVDRQVAQFGSHAIQKYVRKLGKRFVAVGCHYDVIDWLQPDWVLDMATRTFTRRLLQRRPSLDIAIGRLPRAAWKIFSPFHYMTADLPSSAHGFGIWANGNLAASCWVRHFPHPKVRDIKAVSRAVTFPDYQGLGLAFVLADALGAAHVAAGLRLRHYPAHPGFIESFRRSDKWANKKEAGYTATPSSDTSAMGGGGGRRPCAVFEFVGSPNEDYAKALEIGDMSVRTDSLRLADAKRLPQDGNPTQPTRAAVADRDATWMGPGEYAIKPGPNLSARRYALESVELPLDGSLVGRQNGAVVVVFARGKWANIQRVDAVEAMPLKIVRR